MRLILCQFHMSQQTTHYTLHITNGAPIAIIITIISTFETSFISIFSMMCVMFAAVSDSGLIIAVQF